MYEHLKESILVASLYTLNYELNEHLPMLPLALLRLLRYKFEFIIFMIGLFPKSKSSKTDHISDIFFRVK